MSRFKLISVKLYAPPSLLSAFWAGNIWLYSPGDVSGVMFCEEFDGPPPEKSVKSAVHCSPCVSDDIAYGG